MEKQKAGAQIYGYSVCLVAVITFLISTTSFVNSLMDRTDPLHSGYNPPGSPSLASFENYKMDILKSSQRSEGPNQSSYVPDDNTLRTMFESAKSDKIQTSMHNANRNLLISSLLLVICIILFVTHWRWLRKISKAETPV